MMYRSVRFDPVNYGTITITIDTYPKNPLDAFSRTSPTMGMIFGITKPKYDEPLRGSVNIRQKARQALDEWDTRTVDAALLAQLRKKRTRK